MQSTRETRALAYDILSYWERFNHHDQESWVDASGVHDLDIEKVKVNGVNHNVCNTSMCAAGTAVWLGAGEGVFKDLVSRNNDSGWQGSGAQLLGLSADEAYAVFYSDNKSARRFMKAIASGSDKKFEKALKKRTSL